MHPLAKLSSDELEQHLDGFLIRHWSHSAISSFIRNEKSFEKTYIYKYYDNLKSKTSIIGDVYHKTLMVAFQHYKETNEKLSFDRLTMIAHALIDEIGADEYKIEKRLTIIEQQQYVLKSVNFLIENFLAEFDAYADEIQEILFVEPTFVEFVTINGIHIPLPLKIKCDLVFIDKQGYLCILDHKSKYTYTKETDVVMNYANQSITYALGMKPAIMRFPEILAKYPKAKEGVKRFLYYENKFSKNKDGSRQIKQIPMDIEKDGALFEQMLFEGIFRVMEAVQNPDYVYLMNPQDFFEEGDKMVEFWIKTHVEGLDGFPNLKPHQKKILSKRKTAIRRAALTGIPKSIIKSFSNPKDFVSLTQEDMADLSHQERIQHRLKTFNYPVLVEHHVEGYSCDTFLLQVGAGQKISTLSNYRLDIANVLGVRDVRIPNELLEYKGQAYSAIEMNRKESRGLFLTDSDIPSGNAFPIGKTNFNETIVWSIDNPSTPHMMIAGASGSGKSVEIRTIIEVALKKGIEVAILDPKYEFLDLKGKCEVHNELQDIEDFMEYTVLEMDDIFKQSGAKGNSANKRLIIFDEAADCFARQNKERVHYTEGPRGGEKKHVDREFKTLEQNVLILAQKARSAGIHLLLAAQRFSVKVLTGDAKANFPVRLCLTVASKVDSQVMLGEDGAEKLNGKGDGLFVSPEHGQPLRVQCFATQNALK